MEILASIMAADCMRLGEETSAVLSAGANAIHFDVMDHHFVPNFTMGALFCQPMVESYAASVDVHLMVTNPDAHIRAFTTAGAAAVSFHPGTSSDTLSSLQLIRSGGAAAGLVFNPDEPFDMQPTWVSYCDKVVLMSVFPGFCGQTFMPVVCDKVRQARRWAEQFHPSLVIAVDGGINEDNIAMLAAAGADQVVVGSNLFAKEDYAAQITLLRERALG